MSDDYGISVKLKKNFSLVKETLERMGIRNSQEKKFFPSCYCVGNEDDGYKIYHFKELFALDGNESTYNDLDELRRNTIAHFLEKWGLVELDEPIETILEKKIDVLSYNDKPNYRICHKYFFKTHIDNE